MVKFKEYNSNSLRKKPILGLNGMVATSQPLSVQSGLSVLQMGGNAADAAIATAAVLSVIEPMMTGVGGDHFCLFYDSKKKKVFGLNGSGRSPSELTLANISHDKITTDYSTLPVSSPHAVTVPGAVSGWLDTIKKFGTLSVEQILNPAVKIAEKGFPVTRVISKFGILSSNPSDFTCSIKFKGTTLSIGTIVNLRLDTFFFIVSINFE